MIYKIDQPTNVAPLFNGWEESLIWSCLQGVMGELYADDPESPSCAAAFIGDLAFFAGKPNEEIVHFQRMHNPKSFVIMVPQSDGWNEVILHCCGENAKYTERYAIKKEPNCFDKNKLRQIALSLPEGVQLHLIDRELYAQCRENKWSEDLVSQFDSFETYEALGLGVVAVMDGTIVSGATSYTRYKDGIEIEVDTLRNHRRKGLAAACAARLILECLDRNLYPSWDAQNLWSVHLAEKLGYHFSHTYPVFEVTR